MGELFGVRSESFQLLAAAKLEAEKYGWAFDGNRHSQFTLDRYESGLQFGKHQRGLDFWENNIFTFCLNIYVETFNLPQDWDKYIAKLKELSPKSKETQTTMKEFAVHSETFSLLAAAKAEAEKQGWKYASLYDTKEFTEDNWEANGGNKRRLHFLKNKLHFNNGSLSGTYRFNIIVYTLPQDWNEFVKAIDQPVKPEYVKVQLNSKYTADVYKDKVVVGCQTFEPERVEELWKAIQSPIKSAKTIKWISLFHDGNRWIVHGHGMVPHLNDTEEEAIRNKAIGREITAIGSFQIPSVYKVQLNSNYFAEIQSGKVVVTGGIEIPFEAINNLYEAVQEQSK